MSEANPTRGNERQYALFMDLLSHDILNNDQAVLSYLELLLTNPGLDAKTREYAQKAIAHVRTSTLLVENAKNLMAVRAADPNSFLRPTDLIRSVMLAVKELPRFFPSKDVKVRVVQGPPDAYVIGGALADSLVLNALTEMARADPGDEVVIEARITKSEHRNKMCWSLVLLDTNAIIQPGMKMADTATLSTGDSSKMVRMAGFLFASIATQLLGGDFDARERGPGADQGGEFILKLVKAGKP